MNRIDVIVLIGDMLTKLDVLRGSMLPENPHRILLDKLRGELDNLQKVLSHIQFDENTNEFKEITAELKEVNAKIRETIGSVEKVVQTLQTLRRFVKIVDDLIGLAVPFV